MKAKVSMVVLSILLVFGLTINAQTPKNEKVENLVENCYNALTNNNQGVSEAGIFVSIQFKNRFPNVNDRKFVNALEKLASNSDNARISYKAQLAKIYFQNPEWFKNVKIKSILDEQEVYEQIAKKLNTIMFATTDL